LVLGLGGGGVFTLRVGVGVELLSKRLCEREVDL